MSTWPTVELGTVATIDRTAVLPVNVDASTPYVGLDNIERGGAIINVATVGESKISSAKFRFTEQQVLFGKLRPYLAKISRPTFSGVCSTDILPLSPGVNLDKGYLCYFLSLPDTIALAASRASGANLPRLAPKELAKFQIPLPPITEQRRIAQVLDGVDALSAKRRKAIVLLDELAQAIFLDMFGDPAQNPMRWPIKKIGDLVESARYGTSEKARTEGDLPVLRMNNITANGDMNLRDLKYVDRSTMDDRYLIHRGDVLFNRTNSPELVGKVALYRGVNPMAYAGYLVRVRTNRRNAPEYLAAFLNTPHAKRVLRNMCKSIVGMANINAREMQSIEIAEPPLTLQREFATRISAVESFKAAQRAHLAELDTLFASIQYCAFRGELWDVSAV